MSSCKFKDYFYSNFRSSISSPPGISFVILSDLLALNCSIGSRVVLFVIRGWKKHPHPVPGCAENIVNTVVFIRFHVFSC